MPQPWRALFVASLALGSAADSLIDNGVIISYQAANGLTPQGYMYLDQNNTGLGAPRLRTRSIGLADILPSLDSRGNSRCCPLGTVNDGTGCVFPESSVCEPGTRLDGNVCVSDHPPQCPVGLRFNGQVCVSEKPPICPPKAVFNGVLCEAESDPICILPFVYENGQCVSSKPAICRPGFSIRNHVCTSNTPPKCAPNQAFEDGGCVSKHGPVCPGVSKPSGNQCVDPNPPRCEEGYVINNGVCVHRSPPKCPPNAQLKGGVCVREEEPTCELGTFNGRVCEANPSCPDGYQLKGTLCWSEVPLVCPSGLGLRTDAASGKTACCPGGFDHYNGLYCGKEEEDEDECPEDSRWEDGYCWRRPDVPPRAPSTASSTMASAGSVPSPYVPMAAATVMESASRALPSVPPDLPLTASTA